MKPSRPSMPTAVFVGFADGAKEASSEQLHILEQALAAEASLPKPDSSMPVPTGLVLYFNHPSHTLDFVRRLGAWVRSMDWPLPAIRIGVHAATAIRNAGASDTTMSTGSMDGCMRIARFASANQALATTAFQAFALDMLPRGAEHFRDLGRVAGKNGKSAHAFEIVPFAKHATAAEVSATVTKLRRKPQ